MEQVTGTTAREVVGHQHGKEIRCHRIGIVGSVWIWLQRASALRLACETGNRIPKRIKAWGIQSRIDNPKAVILCEERLLIGDTRLHVVNPFNERNIREYASVRQSSVLTNSLRLKWTKVRVRILTGVIVVAVMPHEAAEGKHGARINQARPGRSDVIGLDLGTLVGRPNRSIVGPTGDAHIEIVVGIWILKPGSRETKVQVNRVPVRDLVVDAVEYIFQVAFGMDHGKFRRVEKTTGIQSIHRDEVPPLRSAIGEVESASDRAKRSVRSGNGSMRCRNALP